MHVERRGTENGNRMQNACGTKRQREREPHAECMWKEEAARTGTTCRMHVEGGGSENGRHMQNA
eukprot:8239380-Alexandrium_andersonii.AAC.1